MQLTPDEIEARLAKEDLGIAGKEILKRFAALTEASSHVIMLADSNGQILESVGSRPLRNQLNRINFAPGAAWNEDIVGPNGIGTPLVLGRPEFVFGPEHYCSGWQPWVCYGSPILNPETREVVGVIDITEPVRSVRLERFRLATVIAQCVEQRLQLLMTRRQDLLRASFCDAQRRWPGNGLVVISDAGRIIEANHPALRYLGMAPNDVRDRLMNDVYPALWDLVRGNQDRPTQLEPETRPRSACGSNKLYLEPVHQDGRPIGALLTIAGPNAVSRGQRNSSGASSARFAFSNLLGESPAFKRAIALARAAASDPCENTVLLTGMSGTGKELIAHAIHAAGPRASQPLVILNCAALPSELAESEVFGYTAGAFTGARREGAIGKYEAADGGTLFMDEVDSLPLELQAKLLRVLESGEINAIGSHEKKLVDVRVIAAAGKTLRDRITAGAFRPDLFHRLSVIEIELPTLCSRPDDIELLAKHFLKLACRDAGRDPLQIQVEVMNVLRLYTWPGNIRELRNLCARWALVVQGNDIQSSDLPTHILETVSDAALPEARNGRRELHEIVDKLILKAIEDHGGVAKAARELGINRTTIYRRLKQRSRH